MANITVDTAKSHDRRLDKPPADPPPPSPVLESSLNKSVSFSHSSRIEPDEFETNVIQRVQEYCDPVTFSAEKVVRIIRRMKHRKNDDTFINEVTNAYYDEPADDIRSDTPHPPIFGPSLPIQTQTDDMDIIPLTEIKVTDTDKEKTDLCKAIEESLMTSKLQANTNSYLSAIPENPEDLLRTSGSVGIHNIGQTCWFSVIAQLLYHIPSYRRIVYDLTPADWAQKVIAPERLAEDVSERDVLVAIRSLFAQMEAGNRRFIDPAPALAIVSALNRKNDREATDLVGSQQDAMEMLLRITDWLERAMHKAHMLIQRRAAAESRAANNENVPLGIDTSTSQEAVQQLEAMEISPVTSSSGGDTSGDVMMGSVDNLNMMGDGSSITTRNQAPVFAKPRPPLTLPPLASVQPQTPLGTPPPSAGAPVSEWKDSPLKSIFHGSTVEVKKRADGSTETLRTENSLQMFLLDVDHGELHDAFEEHNFTGTTSAWFDSLPTVLIVSLKRFRYDPVSGGAHKVHSPFSFPQVLFMDRYMQKNSVIVRELMQERKNLRLRLAQVKAELKGMQEYPVGIDQNTAHLFELIHSVQAYVRGETSYPEPPAVMSEPECSTRSFVKEEPKVLPQLPDGFFHMPSDRNQLHIFLQDMKELLANKEAQLMSCETELTRRIQTIYDREELLKEQYELQGLVIHEGAANMGHYWAYIQDPNGASADSDTESAQSSHSASNTSWLKMNDRAVEPATLVEMERDAYGMDRPNTSAYCMVYVKSDADWLGHKEQLPISALLANLPEDLRRSVAEENAELESEIERHREAQKPKPISDIELHGARGRRLALSTFVSPKFVSDPQNLRLRLSVNMEHIFLPNELSALQQKVSFLRDLVQKSFPADWNHDIAATHHLRVMLESSGKVIMKRLEPELWLPVDGEKVESNSIVNGRIHHMSCERRQSLFQKLVTEWYGLSDPGPLLSVLHFWQSTNIGMPSKVHRLFIARMLRASPFDDLVSMAREEVVEFEQCTSSPCYTVIYHRIMADYNMLRAIWCMLRTSVSDMKTNPVVLNYNMLNEYCQKWRRTLAMGLQANNYYDRLVADLREQALAGGRCFDVEKCVVQTYLIRGAIMVPFLRLFSLIIFCLMSPVDMMSNEEIRSVLEHQNCMQMLTSALNMISRFASDCTDKGAEKVLASTIDTLDIMFARTVEVDRESYRAHVVKDLKHAAQSPTLVTTMLKCAAHGVNVQEEADYTKMMSAEVGLADEADVLCTYDRLISETGNYLSQ